jgi:proline iminopeptidase
MDRILDHSNTRIWSTATGAGTPAILCNGGPGCDDHLEPVARIIDDVCQVVRFEPRGCGRSSRDGRYDFQTSVDDVDFVRRAYGFERVWLIGHSAGANVALAYAIQYASHLTGIIGIAGGCMVNDREWSRTYRENLEKTGEDDGGKIWDADAEVNRIGNATFRRWITNTNLWRDLSRIHAPTTFIAAGNDIRPNWPIQQLANLLPRGKYVEIAGAGHSIWLTHAVELRMRLREAIQRTEEA